MKNKFNLSDVLLIVGILIIIGTTFKINIAVGLYLLGISLIGTAILISKIGGDGNNNK